MKRTYSKAARKMEREQQHKKARIDTISRLLSKARRAFDKAERKGRKDAVEYWQGRITAHQTNLAALRAA